jgi:hypothetical protein
MTQKKPNALQENNNIQEILLDELKSTRTRLQECLLSQSHPLSTETAHAYNTALFHLQSAREEIKRVMRTLK